MWNTSRALTFVRRPGVDAGISLRKRRAWFADGDDQGQSGGDQKGGESGQDDPMVSLEALLSATPDNLKPAIQLLIGNFKKVQKEAGDNRIAAKKAADDKAAGIAAAEAAALAEQGKFKELYEKTVKELDALKPHQERVQVLEAKIAATNEAKIKRIPETHKSMIPVDYTPEQLSEWLDANEALLTKPTPPPTDLGKGGEGGGQNSQLPKLTDEQRSMARKNGMTDEQFAKALQATTRAKT